LTQVIDAAIEGFHIDMLTAIMPDLQPSEINDDIQELLNRGGIYSMHQPVLTVFCAFFFAAAIEVSGALKIVVSKTLSYVLSTSNTILVSFFSALAIILSKGNRFVTNLVMKDVFGEQYDEKSLHRLNLS